MYGLLSSSEKAVITSLLKEFQLVFDSCIPGYNGEAGPIEGVVKMGPVEPLQHKGHVPQYSCDQLDQLQTKFDDLETRGLFHRPEDLKAVLEYLNPSFLVKKRNDGFCLVTAFTDVGRYSKCQPSLMLDVDSTLLKSACWKHSPWFVPGVLPNPPSKEFHEVLWRGYNLQRCSCLHMLWHENPLEELTRHVLGDLLQGGCVVKIADDLYCGGNSDQELLTNWHPLSSGSLQPLPLTCEDHNLPSFDHHSQLDIFLRLNPRFSPSCTCSCSDFLWASQEFLWYREFFFGYNGVLRKNMPNMHSHVHVILVCFT